MEAGARARLRRRARRGGGRAAAAVVEHLVAGWLTEALRGTGTAPARRRRARRPSRAASPRRPGHPSPASSRAGARAPALGRRRSAPAASWHPSGRAPPARAGATPAARWAGRRLSAQQDRDVGEHHLLALVLGSQPADPPVLQERRQDLQRLRHELRRPRGVGHRRRHLAAGHVASTGWAMARISAPAHCPTPDVKVP